MIFWPVEQKRIARLMIENSYRERLLDLAKKHDAKRKDAEIRYERAIEDLYRSKQQDLSDPFQAIYRRWGKYY